MNVEANINQVYHLADKVVELNMFAVVFEVNLCFLKNMSNSGLTLV